MHVVEKLKVTRVLNNQKMQFHFFLDYAQIINTEKEIVMQFYESIPGPPSPDSQIKNVKTRLKATITVGLPHAETIGKLLLKKMGLENEIIRNNG